LLENIDTVEQVFVFSLESVKRHLATRSVWSGDRKFSVSYYKPVKNGRIARHALRQVVKMSISLMKMGINMRFVPFCEQS